MKMKKRKKHAKKPVGFLIFVLIILIGVVSVQMSRLYIRNVELDQEAAQLTQEKESALKYQKELLEYKDFMNSTQYIEQIAREKLGLVKPNDTLFVTPSE